MGTKRKLAFLLPNPVIEDAVALDPEAAKMVVMHYEGYMRKLLYDNIRARNIKVSDVPTEDILQEVKLELFSALIKFQVK